MTLLSYSASTALLAYDSVALRVGMVVGALVFPVLGLILLIIGLVERSKANRPRPPYVPGYPGHPVPPSYPGYPPPPGYPLPYLPPPPPRSTAGRGLIAAGSILLVLSLIGIAGRAATGVGDRAAAEKFTPPVKVGQCITGEALASGTIGASDIISCTDTNGVFEVVSAGIQDAKCPDGKRDDTDFARWTNDQYTVCFLPNLQTGQCYAAIHGTPTPTEPNRGDTLEPVDCTATSAAFRVVKRANAADFDLCPPGTKQRIWTMPPRTYCTGPPS